MDNEPRYTIDDLVELTGCSRRTIRFYVERGLLEAPAGRGRGGFYGDEHLVRLREIIAAREEGRSLASIQASLGAAGIAAPASAREQALAKDGLPRRSSRWDLLPGISLVVEDWALAGHEGLIEEIRGLAARKS